MSAKKVRTQSLLVYILLTLAVFSVSVAISSFKTLKKTELAYRDKLFDWRGPLSVKESPVVLVQISQQADDEIPEKYPWPTSIYARLINNLNRAGAAVILMDVIFDQPDIYSPHNDTLLAEAIRNHGGVVLAGQVNTVVTNFGRQNVEVFPQPVLQNYNPNSVGMVAMIPDLDGYIRSYSFGLNYNNLSYYMLGIEGVQIYKDLKSDESDRPGISDSNYFKIGSFRIPKHTQNSFMINYYGPEGQFPVYSLDNVIDDDTYTTVMEANAFEMNLFDDPDTQTGLLYDEVFKDKIVIVGSTMPLLKDFFPTPFSREEFPRPGYEIHAHAIQTILDNNFIYLQSNSTVLLTMIILAFLVVYVNQKKSMQFSTTTVLLVLVVYVLLAYLLFIRYNFILNIFAISIVLIIGQVISLGYEVFVVERERRRIQSMFSTYVSPELVEQMVQSGEQPTLGGEEIYLTALFSDIESFTTIAEQLDAKQLVKLINEYLSSMTKIITDEKGTLDKYIGDAIVAFFGAPLPVSAHAYHACITSQLMQKELEMLQKRWWNKGWSTEITELRSRIGINTGLMVTGNMGSDQRFNYTIMGDNVNIASRCESAAKYYGVYTMVTEATKLEAEKFGDELVFRQLDNVVMKGRAHPIRVYEIVALKSDVSQKLYEGISLYEKGLELYYEGSWKEAAGYFESAARFERYDKNPSQILLKRCHYLAENPPEGDWNGVHFLEEK